MNGDRLAVEVAILTPAVGRARRYLGVARSDSLVRNSLCMMISTIVTAGLGYVFWIVTARSFTRAQVGTASAIISLCTTLALLTYLGAQALLIERLHIYERSRKWTAVLAQICAITVAATTIVALVVIPFLAHSTNYGSFFTDPGTLAIAILGTAAWTLVNMLSAAFIAARRADGVLSLQGLVSLLKVMSVLPLAALGLGTAGIVVSWVASAIVGGVMAAAWSLPRLKLGRRPDGLTSHRATENGRPPDDSRGCQRPGYRGTRRRSAVVRSSDVRNLLGQHFTSIGGALTPLVLPVLVSVRVGDVNNAYFYVTWMVGSAFFMVSPAISSALFAESVRARSGLRPVIIRAFRVTSMLLIPAIIIMIMIGKYILAIFGKSYVSAGYGLLVWLALSAVPDAVSNIAIAVLRVTGRLIYSAALNLSMMISALIGSWFLMPKFGIAAAGICWLAAQVLGAIASVPAFLNLASRTER